MMDAATTAAPHGSLKVLCTPPNFRKDGTPIARVEKWISNSFCKDERIIFCFFICEVEDGDLRVSALRLAVLIDLSIGPADSMLLAVLALM